MDFLGVIQEEGDLLSPNFFPTKGGVVVWGMIVDFNAPHQSFLEGLFFSFTFSWDEDSFTAH